MADHGEVEYATAQGNDYGEHEGTYNFFVRLATFGTLHVIAIVIGLAIGGTTGHWLVSFGLIVFATIAAGIGLVTDIKWPSFAMVVVGLLALLAVSGGH
jgi:hypothetical protein